MRVVAAAAIAAAIAGQAIVTIGGASELGRDVPTVTVNFFSFFTILSNIVAALVLTWAALSFWAGRSGARRESGPLAFALACATAYMVVTGIVYNLLLRGIALEPGATLGWSNEILHVAGPVFMLVDLFVGPSRRALPWKAVLGVLVFPLAWVMYTMLRGPQITNPRNGDPWWYPYPFLDPHSFGSGYLGVTGYVAGIAVAIGLVAVVVVWVGRRRA